MPEKPAESIIHPDFSRWLDGPRANEEDIEGILRDILDNLLGHFLFNQFDIANNPERRLNYDPDSDILTVLANENSENLSDKCGNCFDLAVKAYKIISKKYPEALEHMVILSGNEPDYYHTDGACHQVLVYAETVLINGNPMRSFKEQTDKSTRLKISLENRAAIIDPTFNRIAGLEDSGYKLGQYTPICAKARIPLNAFAGGMAIPFAMTGKGTHVYFDYDGKLMIGLQEPRREPEFKYFDDHSLQSRLSDDPEILENLAALERGIKKIKSSRFRLPGIDDWRNKLSEVMK